MPFLIFSNADIRFAEKELEWRRYSIAEARLTTRRVEIIDKKEFSTTAMDKNAKTFAVLIATLSALTMLIHCFCQI